VLLAVVPREVTTQVQSASAPDEGKRVFETVCVACHTIGAGVRIGPDLQGVAERRTVEWLRPFIRDPEQMRAAGDSIAAANLAQYGIKMPNLGLTEQQVDGVITHLGGAEPAPAGRPALYLPTLALAVLAAAGITVIAMTLGTKRVETRA
jgi:mono/diheme cytochrome c family protein